MSRTSHVRTYSVQLVQFSRSVVSNSLWPHESQYTRPPCPSPSPRVHSNSHPSSQWCHPAISPSVVPFSSCPQSLPASESFPVSQLFAWGGQRTGVSALAIGMVKFYKGDQLCCWLLSWQGWGINKRELDWQWKSLPHMGRIHWAMTFLLFTLWVNVIIPVCLWLLCSRIYEM